MNPLFELWEFLKVRGVEEGRFIVHPLSLWLGCDRGWGVFPLVDFLGGHHAILKVYLGHGTSVWRRLGCVRIMGRYFGGVQFQALINTRLMLRRRLLVLNDFLSNCAQSLLDDLGSKVWVVHVVLLICLHITGEILLPFVPFDPASLLFLLVCDLR